MLQNKIDSIKTKNRTDPVRRDLIAIGIVILIACALVLHDPDKVFEWLAGRREVQFDEYMVAVSLVGAGLAVFSWRRWSDLSRQVAEYQRVQVELSALHKQASLMSETDDLLQACLSSKEACGIAIRHLETQIPAMSGAIFMVTEDQKTAELAVSWGTPALRQKFFPLEECWAVRRGRLYHTSAADPRLGCAHIGPTLPAYALCLPMMAQGETMGVLYLDSSTVQGEATALTPTEELNVRILAEHLALAVANLKLRETLRVEAIRDPLTGLFNRRYMEEALKQHLSRVTRHLHPLGIIMIDIDHFKSFNDVHGHTAGDQILRELGKFLQSHVRGEDTACRYGGEEFILIMPDVFLEAARNRAEQLRREAKDLRVEDDGQLFAGITLSIGVALYPLHGRTIENVLRAADSALYRAKQAGRDQVVIAETVD